MLSKEEIEKAKEDLIFFNEGDYITREMDKSADVLEEYIQELEESNKDLDHENNRLEKIEFERDKANKVIDEMAKYLVKIDLFGEMCENISEVDCKKFSECKICLKQYFEKKVEEEYER